jgi:general secretion pathway protein C
MRAPAPETTTSSINSAKVAQLLGAGALANDAAPASIAQTKYKLLGVITEGTLGGSALIAIDDKPAKPFRIGDPVMDDLVLKSVEARSATLGAKGQGGEGIILELPPLPGTP